MHSMQYLLWVTEGVLSLIQHHIASMLQKGKQRVNELLYATSLLIHCSESMNTLAALRSTTTELASFN